MKVTLYMAMSIDGFIATAKDETPWSDAEWESYRAFIQEHGNLIIGRRTYEIMERDGEFPRIGNPFTVVVSESRPTSANGRVRFVKTPAAALAALKEQGLTRAVVGGGGTLNGSFLRAGLINDVVLDVEPVVLGSGVRLFGPETMGVRLQLQSAKAVADQFVQLRYTVQQ